MSDISQITVTDRLNKFPDEYRYLLLDPLKSVSEINPLHLYNLQQNPGEDAIHSVLRRDLAYSPAHCPLLVLLASPGEKNEWSWLAASEDYARNEILHEKRYLCAWISSPQPPKVLANILAEQCDNFIENRCLPFFEPLRFELLHTIMAPEYLSGKIWPVSHWWYMSTTGDIVCQSGKPSDKTERLNWGAENAQQDTRDIWKLLYAWLQVCPNLSEGASKQAATVWRETARLGLPRNDDRHFLALNRLTLPVDIEQHPAIQALLQQVIADPSQSFRQLIRTLPDHIWQEMENNVLPQLNNVSGAYHYGA